MDRRSILEDLRDPTSGKVRVSDDPATPEERCNLFVGSLGLVAALLAYFLTMDLVITVGVEIAVMVPLKRYHRLCDL